MKSSRKNHYQMTVSLKKQTPKTDTRTPSNIKRASGRETSSYSIKDINFPRISEGVEEGLQGGRAHAEENKNVDDEKFVVSCQH